MNQNKDRNKKLMIISKRLQDLRINYKGKENEINRKNDIYSELTQAKLASITGIGKNSLSKYETGQSLPNPENAQKLADFYNINVEYLLNPDVINPKKENIEIGAFLNLTDTSISNIQETPPEINNAFLESSYFIVQQNYLMNLAYLNKVRKRTIEYRNKLEKLTLNELHNFILEISESLTSTQNTGLHQFYDIQSILEILIHNFEQTSPEENVFKDLTYDTLNNLLLSICSSIDIIKFNLSKDFTKFVDEFTLDKNF